MLGSRWRSARLLVGIVAGLGCAGIGCAGMDAGSLDGLLEGSLGPRALDESTIASGLRDALRVGAENAVRSTSRRDGFLGNERIRIPLPESLEGVGKALRTVGFGAQLDDLEVAMNRGAETAAGEAGEVFLGAIRDLTIEDARSILQGDETAATRYLQRTTSGELERRFSPLVDTALREVGAVRLHDTLMDRYRSIPLAPDPGFDLREYVTDEALDGLFFVLGEEEKRIRTDPAARTTELLRRVFGDA